MIVFYTDDPDDAMRSEGKQVLYRITSVEALALPQLLHLLYCPTPLESRND
jgi:hypothetical protein